MTRVRRVFHLDSQDRESTLETLAGLLTAEPGLRFAYVHGSFLGTSGFRDIDVGVSLSEPPDRRLAHVLDLAGRLTARVGFPVDVRPLDEAPVSFLFHVLRSGRLLLVRDDGVVADMIERTARTYHDIAPLLRQAAADAFSHDAQS